MPYRCPTDHFLPFCPTTPKCPNLDNAANSFGGLICDVEMLARGVTFSRPVPSGRREYVREDTWVRSALLAACGRHCHNPGSRGSPHVLPESSTGHNPGAGSKHGAGSDAEPRANPGTKHRSIAGADSGPDPCSDSCHKSKSECGCDAARDRCHGGTARAAY